jgi:hypothetical protein
MVCQRWGASRDKVEQILLGDSAVFARARDVVDVELVFLREVSNSWSCQSFRITW